MLQNLIDIYNLKIEDKVERMIVELAILENKKPKEIKALSTERIEQLIEKHKYLYENPTPISQFIIEGKVYKLPLTLFGLPYGMWEDMEVINSNNQFGEIFWEKLPYILYILTYGNDYVKDNASDNIVEGSEIFKKISVKDALGVSAFFLTLKSQSNPSSHLSMRLIMRKLQKMSSLLSFLKRIRIIK